MTIKKGRDGKVDLESGSPRRNFAQRKAGGYVASEGIAGRGIRHKANHLPAKLVMAHAAEEVAQADDLLAEVRSLQARTLSILEAAEAARQLPTALRAIKEARSNVELLAKLVGQLQADQLAQQNVQINVVYEDEKRQRIIAELEEFERRRRERLEREQDNGSFSSR